MRDPVRRRRLRRETVLDPTPTLRCDLFNMYRMIWHINNDHLVSQIAIRS